MKNIKINILLIINVLRASFISLVPYYILYSFILLSVEIFKYLNLFNPSFTVEDSSNIVELINMSLPILLNISISYHLSTIYYLTINRFLTIILSLCIYFSVEVITKHLNINNHFIPESFILAISIPLLSIYILSYIIQLLGNYQNKLNGLLSKNITTMIVYSIPFSVVFFIVTFLFSSITIYLSLGDNFVLFQETQESLLLFTRGIISSVLWFFGIHGVNLFDSMIDTTILKNLMHPNLTYINFYNLFVLFGGVGSGLSLLIAIFISSKDKHTTIIAKMATPFVLFNINEILIFGIPIIMNVSLIIPFILVPTINLILSYCLLSFTDIIVFSDIYLPWTTPALFNMYLATDGNFIAVFFQLFLIILGTLIYIPFIKKYTRTQSSTISLEDMANKFDITTSFESKEDIKFHEAQSSLIKSHYKINDIIKNINNNNLILYYQPKVNVQENNCNDFEALLRIKNSDGSISSPHFIIDIENSGLASILDVWVCKEVKKDLDLWSKKDYYPTISINIFPYTLEDKNYVNEIIGILKEYNVDFEIIERRSALNEKIYENVNLLKENNFKISLDDLGIGFTNFSMLYEIPFDMVKIDKQIIQFTNTKRGFILYQNICHLCVNLNLKIALEGVETKEEYEKLVNEDITFIQGWYFSKALPFNKVEAYSKNFNHSLIL